MFRRRVFRLAAAAVCLGAAVVLVQGKGVAGRDAAPVAAAAAMRAVRFAPLGEPLVQGEVDRLTAWALERSRPGPAGRELPAGEGGAVRYRVRWPGGGEVVVTAGGLPWLVRRPVPSDPGPDLLPAEARRLAVDAMAMLVPDAARFRAARAQTFREEERLWHRFHWSADAGPLPPGWEREIEVEVAGSTVVSVQRRVKPLGTDLGVVAGRVAELRRLSWVAAVALGVLVAGIVLAGAEGLAFRRHLAVARGTAVGAAAGALEAVAGGSLASAALFGLVVGVTVAAMPIWEGPGFRRPLAGVPVGVVAAMLAAVAPAVVTGAGGFMPSSSAAAGEEPWRLAARSWRTALVEETLLRGALPGLLAPVAGFWGSAWAGVLAGSLLHPVPSVPLAAAVAATGAVQGAMVLAARWGGVWAAVLARGVAETLLQRAAFPTGAWWSAVAVLPVAAGAAVLAVRGEKQ